MKKFLKNNLKVFIAVIITAIICISGTVYAVISYQADEIEYKDGTVKDALDDLYDMTNASSDVFCLFSSDQYGQKGQVGAKYICDPGDGVLRNFFILAKDGNNVKLIMEQNLSDTIGSARTMNYATALSYFTTGDGVSTKNAWTNVLNIDLPNAQDIANAVGNTSWTTGSSWFCLGLKDQSSCSAGNWTYATNAGKTAVAPYKWLFNYTRECTAFGCDVASNTGAYGYWTKDLLANNNARAWCVFTNGNLSDDSITSTTLSGVRPVITVLKSNLYSE